MVKQIVLLYLYNLGETQFKYIVLKGEKWKAQAQKQSDSHCNTNNQHKHNSSACHEFVLLLIFYVATMSQNLSRAYKDDETVNIDP